MEGATRLGRGQAKNAMIKLILLRVIKGLNKANIL